MSALDKEGINKIGLVAFEKMNWEEMVFGNILGLPSEMIWCTGIKIFMR